MERYSYRRLEGRAMNLYVVRNRQGKYFRSIGYGGTGENWVDTLDKAKFYPRIGQAKARVTYFTKNWPDYGTPDILEFTLDVAQAKVLDMAETTKKSIARIAKRELDQEHRNRQYEIECLQRDQGRLDARRKELTK